MSNGKERAATVLRGPEGEEIYLRLVRYAERLARMHGWRVGADLPGASSPKSIVNDVVIKVLEGVRIWDERREPSLWIGRFSVDFVCHVVHFVFRNKAPRPAAFRQCILDD